MEKLFQDLLNISGVQGLFLISEDEKVVFESLDGVQFFSEKSAVNWKMIADCIGDFVEMDLVYEGGRYYVKKAGNYLLVVLLTLDESLAMVKLNSDIAMSELKKMTKNGRGLFRFLNLRI